MAKVLIGNFKGPQGDIGATGLTGAQGPTGATGAQGPTGATGQRGSRWSGGTAITGTSTTNTVFSGTGITDSLVNDCYLNTTTGNTYRCTLAGNASTAKWVYTGNIKGATGDTGATGPQGATGATGATGAQGPTGATGATGAQGVRGSRWTQGTAITGTSTTDTVFSGTGITDSLVNDCYLNTTTGNTYRCTLAGNASTAKWVYTGNIKGATPSANDLTPTYSEATDLANIESGEVLSIAFGKIKKAISTIISHVVQNATVSALGHVKLSDSSAVTDSTGLALPVTEKNATISGTLAYQIATLNSNLDTKLNANMKNMSAVAVADALTQTLETGIYSCSDATTNSPGGMTATIIVFAYPGLSTRFAFTRNGHIYSSIYTPNVSYGTWVVIC